MEGTYCSFRPRSSVHILFILGLGGSMCCIELYHSSTISPSRTHGSRYSHSRETRQIRSVSAI